MFERKDYIHYLSQLKDIKLKTDKETRELFDILDANELQQCLSKVINSSQAQIKLLDEIMQHFI